MGNNKLFKKDLDINQLGTNYYNREHRRICIAVKDNCLNNVHD